MNATFGTSRQAGRLGLRTPVGHHACPPTMRVRPPTLPNWKNVAIQQQSPLGKDAFQLMAFNRPSAPTQQAPSWNPVEVVKREQGLQSNKLPTALRESVESAVEQLRFRVTVGDVAARAGVKLRDADDALKALAYDSQAALEVSEQGDVVYNFDRSFRSSIKSRSLWLSAQPAFKGVLKAAQYLVRVAFGTALVSSIAIVWFAIVVLLSSKGDRDERRDSRGGGGYYNGYSSYNGGGLGPRLYFNLTDLLIYLDPNYASTSHERIARGNNLTFIEAIFSFVFGDGDPNAEFDAQRWAALGQVIQDRGGVVTAEEMAPFLDPPPIGNEGRYTEESFVLPALIRFGGEAEVDENTGMLLYRFPQFQASGVTQGAPAFAQEWVRGRDGRPYPAPQAPTVARGPMEVPQERTWELTAASMGQVLGVVALGVFNVAGVVTLSGLLADPQARYALTYQGLGWITNLLPALQIYAAAFFGIPAIRTLFNLPTNSAIAQRNGARQQAANLLNSGKKWLSEKLGAARRGGVSRTVRKSDVVFTTEKEATQQLNAAEENEWDKRFQSNNPRSEPIRETAPRAPGQREPPSDARPVQRARDYDGRWK